MLFSSIDNIFDSPSVFFEITSLPESQKVTKRPYIGHNNILLLMTSVNIHYIVILERDIKKKY